MSWLAQTASQLRSLWSGRSRAQQAGLVGIALTAIVLVVVLMKIGSQQSYATAFTNLDAKDASAAADELKADHIPYQLSQDGATIKVPPADLAEARLKLAAKGLPQGGAVGFELFDKTSFGVTDFVQNVNYQRALEGELTRTIEALDAVQSAKVNIAVPKDDVFVSQQQPASASVLLTLRPGRSLDASALRGIAHLISRSVQGLEEQNIAIVDSGGQTLFDGQTAASSVGDASTQQQVESQIETQIENRLQTLLDRVAGPNRSAVRVKADIDFSQGTTSTESYSPGGPNNQGVTSSSSTVQETYAGPGVPPAQIPGASANIPGLAAAAATPGARSQYQRTETTNNYQVSKTTQQTTQAPGQVKRLSISVVLDSSITDQDAAGLKDALSAAAGLDPSRGDQITVTTAAFSSTGATTPIVVQRPGLLDQATKYGKFAVPLLAALLVVFAVWRMSRSAAPAQPRLAVVSGVPALPPPPGAMLPYTYPARGLAGEDAALGLPGPNARDGAEGLSPSELAAFHEELRGRVVGLVEQNPEMVAALLRSWLNESPPTEIDGG